MAAAAKRKEYICAYPVQCLNGTGLYLSKQTYPAGITKFLLHILSLVCYNHISPQKKFIAPSMSKRNPRGAVTSPGVSVLTALCSACQATCIRNTQLRLLRQTAQSLPHHPLRFTSFPLLGRSEDGRTIIPDYDKIRKHISPRGTHS